MTAPTLRQYSAAAMSGERPPPAIDDAEACAARQKARDMLAECAALLRKIEGPRHA